VCKPQVNPVDHDGCSVVCLKRLHSHTHAHNRFEPHSGWDGVSCSPAILEELVVWRLQWWLSFRRNATFWAWVRDTYSDADLRGLITEATDCDLIRLWNPWADPDNDPFSSIEVDRRKLPQALMKRYGEDIWNICIVAGGWSPAESVTGIHCLARLDLASQVYSPDTFNEFMVRNALRRAANQVLEGRFDKGRPRHAHGS